jgi:predicted nucleic acid-binding protein
MILLDSSVVIDYARGKDPKLLSLFRALSLAVCGVVRTEVLAGARSGADRNKLTTLLDSLAQVPIPESIWDTIGDNLRTLRASGVTVPFPDAVLATVAISSNIEFWARDVHFTLVQGALPALKLFQEPP